MLVQAFLENYRRFPRKLAVRDPTRELTYTQLAAFAAVIRRVVLEETRCPRVGMMLPASAGGLGTILGTLWAGRTLVPLNFLLQPRELAAVIADARIDLVISIQHFQQQLAGIPVSVLYLEHLNLKRRYFWQRLRRTPDPPHVAPDDLAAIVYTSGTTGQPKGVCLSHDNFHSNCRAAIEVLRITPEEHLLGIIPPFHVFGLTGLHLIPIVLGTSVTYIPRFSPQATCRAIEETDISILMGVPSMYAAVARLKGISPEKFARIRLALSGGEALPRRVYDEFYERTGVQLMEGYGLTETSPIVAVNLPWTHRVGTIGKPIPGVEIRVVDSTGHLVGPDQEGELQVRGPLIMKGYFHRPEETAAVIDQDGWFRTGDLVRVHDGYITITGRAKDIIIVGGENVYPREVESVLEEHPAVAESVAFGQSDDRRGEVVVAAVTLRDGTQVSEEELREFCRQRLASYKTPRRVHIRPELARGPSGKIAKRELKALLAD